MSCARVDAAPKPVRVRSDGACGRSERRAAAAPGRFSGLTAKFTPRRGGLAILSRPRCLLEGAASPIWRGTVVCACVRVKYGFSASLSLQCVLIPTTLAHTNTRVAKHAQNVRVNAASAVTRQTAALPMPFMLWKDRTMICSAVEARSAFSSILSSYSQRPVLRGSMAVGPKFSAARA